MHTFKMPFKKLQITNLKCALVSMAIYALISGTVSTYIASMLTTIEKRFDFNSSEMGALMGANDIGYLLCVILISYIGSKHGRQPKILFLSAVGLWLSSMLYTLPYFIYGARYKSEDLNAGNTTGTKDVCLSNLKRIASRPGKGFAPDNTRSQQTVTMFIFMVAGIVNGIATCPFWNIGISFLDDMTGAAKSGIYIGILFAMRSVAPMIGFIFGSFMSKIHESLKFNVNMYPPGQRDLKWIGAWWLGWFVLGWAALVIGPFLGLLRINKFKDEVTNLDQEHVKEGSIQNSEKIQIKETIIYQLKELLSIIATSLRNKIYVSLIVGIIFDIISNVCLLTFFTKYLEYHFRASTSKTNILAAISLAGSRLVSCIMSGIISRTTKMSVRSMNRFNALTNTISAVLFPILFIFTCPTANVTGLNYDFKVCSGFCQCQYNKLNPVCLDTKTYFSPCVAGCLNQINKTFFGGCNCNHTMVATKGFCERMCPSIYGFLVAFFIIKIIGSLSSVQFITVILRLCDPKFKAVNLSLIGFTFGIFGLSFPPLAGILLDSACNFRNTNLHGGKSYCLLYNTDKMRYLIIGVAFIFQIPSCILYILAWIWTPFNPGNQNGTTAMIDIPKKPDELHT